jgi:hypothetical protein
MWIVTITGFWMLMVYFVPGGFQGEVATQLKAGATLIAGFVLCYSGFIALRRNAILAYKRVSTPVEKWYWSLYMVVICLIYIISSLVSPDLSAAPLPDWLYSSVFIPGIGATFSALAFWNMAAVLKIIKPRTMPVAVLVITMLIGFLAASPVVVAFVPALGDLATWLNFIPGGAGSRGIIMCIGIGAIALSIRLLLQQERGWLGER